MGIPIHILFLSVGLCAVILVWPFLSEINKESD